MPESSTDRFRSATEFPKTVQNLDIEQADAVYREMRDCLIFTNRSRAQLIRRNEEHKTKTSLLKEDVQRLHGMIQKLAGEKQQIVESNEETIRALEIEMQNMMSHLDELSIAFEGVADAEASRSPLSLVASPGRFFRFLNAVRAIVMWWRDERSESSPSLPVASQTTALPGDTVNGEEDRRDRPQMYQDQASINRSLLDR
ncbi:hypothetical protein [Leptolyngbya sp. FACHB-16]|uniref:hypothetical protein n=1 Tax=unclassified Leptolyngbya TaxID=2650499 RepID=UPI001687CEE7|nr:hypothetical protein [Leptolyngbya sp. FACHB-16]MBD2153220.1 hypothetical protein [Leptolyngbya sp. FACHB-16]